MRGRKRGEKQYAHRHVLIIVENLPVPFDRRVWLECRALKDEGYDVSVVCPKGPGDPSQQVLEGVSLYKYRLVPARGGLAGYVREYLQAFVMTCVLAAKAYRREPYQVVQSCNPPDIFWPIGVLMRVFTGAKFVFDHHDLSPELYRSRFPDGGLLQYRVLRLLERSTHHFADHIIATNDSYRDIALTRGGRNPADVTVVRTGPDLSRLTALRADVASAKQGFQAVYIGVMGPQDGVDIVLSAAEKITTRHARNDIKFTLVGSGDCFDDLVAMRDRLGLQDHVEFTGRVSDEEVSRLFSRADIGLSPDPKNPLNDVSTMNKTMEYMAFGLPVVAFDLTETRRSAGDAAVYVEPNDVDRYADAIVALLDDERRRQTMSALAWDRVRTVLAWEHQRRAYLAVYDQMFDGVPTGSVAPAAG